MFCFKPAYLGLQSALSHHRLCDQATVPIILTECRDLNHNPIWGTSCALNTASTDIKQIKGTTDWTKIEFTVKASHINGKFLRLLCYNTPGGAGTGTIWCDNLRVEETAPAPAGAPGRAGGSPLFKKDMIPT